MRIRVNFSLGLASFGLLVAAIHPSVCVAAGGRGQISARDGGRLISFTSTRDVVIPQVMDGGGWATSIILMNPGKTSVEAGVLFFGDNGQPLNLPIKQLNGQRSSALTVRLRTGESIVIDTTGTDGTTLQGWGGIVFDDSEGLLTGMAIFRQRVQGRPDFEAVVPLSPYDEVEFVMPFDNRAGFTTGFAVANPDGLDSPIATIQFTFLDPDGGLLLEPSIQLPGANHTAFTLPGKWPVLQGKNGMMIVRTTGRQLSALGLRFNDSGAFTSFHTLSLPPDPPTQTTPTVPPSLPGVSTTCSAMQGAGIVAQDGTFLGIINSNKYLTDSIANQYGTYGSAYSSTSIFNQYGQYGSNYSSLSPFNQYATQPPYIVIQGAAVAYMTTNTAKSPRIDPTVVLGCVGRTR